MQNNDSLVVPFFKSVAVKDVAASLEAGRPIFKDREEVEIRIAGDRNFAPVFPAHSMWKRIDGEEITYAQRWPEAYERFKAGQEQVAEGTPLSELPFLTEAKRAELRALKVYTAEALASLDGKNLSNLGADGRALKNQAAAYIEKAAGGARDVALAAENEALRAELEALRGQGQILPQKEPGEESDEAPDSGEAGGDEAEKERLKARIQELTGSRPRGNPSVSTLRDMLGELETA